MNLIDTLFLKAKKGELGHFYILEPNRHDDEASEILSLFVKNFLDQYFKFQISKNEVPSIDNNPDVFFLGNQSKNDEKKSASYHVDDLAALNDFMQFRSLLGDRKFVIIPEAQKLSLIISNKLLKLLEEPPVETTLFLLNSQKLKLIDTLHSRAIHLRISPPPRKKNSPLWEELIEDVKEYGLHNFLEKYSKSNLSVDSFSQYLINWESEQFSNFKSKHELKNWLITLEEMNTFNQPTATKWTLFYHHLLDHVLPRLRD
jgi:hypothetical protein